MHNEAMLLAAHQAANNMDGDEKRTVRVWTHVSLSRQTREGLTKTDQAQLIFRCLTRHRTSGGAEKFIANAFRTFRGDRVRLSENICVELNLFNGACGTVLEIFSSTTVDPRASRPAAASRMAENPDLVDLPVVILQLDEGSYRGPSISQRAPWVIAIEARKLFIVKPFSEVLWQLPLVPAHASTVHKVQSLTLPVIVVDAIRFRAACSVYVALSRVQELGHLALARPLTWNDIEKHKREIDMISNHMERFRKTS